MGEICVSVLPATVDEGLRLCRRALRSGADLIEVRLDRMPGEEPIEKLFARKRLRTIATCRFPRDGGFFRGSLEERRELLVRAMRAGARWIDLEHWEEWQPPVVPGCAVIRSFHDLRGTPRDLLAIRERLLQFEPDLVKVVVTAYDLPDLEPIVQLWRNPVQVPTIAFAMGRRGAPSRVLCLKFGAPFTYAAIASGHELAPGMLSVQELVGLYHAAEVGPRTRIFGLLGQPLGHSLSPSVHNRALRMLGKDAVYLPFETDHPEATFRLFTPQEWGGMSVTAPHKERMLAVADVLDPEVADTGALNTLSFHGGQVRGSNTDVGAVRSALEFVRVRGTLRGQRGCVLGTGGAARAAAVALLYEGVEVRLMGRSRDRIKDFARDRQIEFARLSSELLSQWAPAVVVHCTPVGTTPGQEESLLTDWKIEPETVVMDLVYNPAETALLRRAKRSGARTVSGLMVFLLQAAAQLKLWTGEDVEPTALLSYCGPGAAALSGFMA